MELCEMIVRRRFVPGGHRDWNCVNVSLPADETVRSKDRQRLDAMHSIETWERIRSPKSSRVRSKQFSTRE